MIEMKELTNEDIEKNPEIFQVIYDLFGSYTGIFYKYVIDGKEKILHRIDDLFTILYYENSDDISYEMFEIDNAYNIKALGCDDYEVSFDKDGPIFTSRDNHKIERVCLVKRVDDVDIDGYNGLITYIQYIPDNDTRTMISYQMNIVENSTTIYEQRLKTPFTVIIEKNVTKKFSKSEGYIVRKGNVNTWTYNFMTIKDYGLRKFLEKGSLSLQNEKEEIKRYYKMKHQLSNGYSLDFFPFCKQYKLEDLYEKLKEINHNPKIPEFILDFCNGRYSSLDEYKELAEILKEVEKEECFNPFVLSKKNNNTN